MMGSQSFYADFASPADWAAMYRRAGFQVVPCHMPQEGASWKRPALADWKTFQDELASDAVFARWYGQGGEHARRSNMGVITGRASGNIFVIDLDTHTKPQAAEWWDRTIMLNNFGIASETWEQVTGGGGRQLFFRAPADWTAPTNKTSIGVDIRGQGGFAVLPPSIHSSGREYAWVEGFEPWTIPISDAPEWLLGAVEELVEQHGGHQPGERAERTSSPNTDFNAFGRRIDGREDYMAKVVWGAMVDFRRDTDGVPSEQDRTTRRADAFAAYARNVKPRIDGPGSPEDRLEREGRGWSAFCQKWAYAFAKWDGKVSRDAAERPRQRAQQPPSPAPETPPREEAPAPGPFRASELTGKAPERDWLVQDWIAAGVVNSLYGAGGVGKTLIAQQLAYCLAIGAPFIGIPTTVKKVFAVLCEDDRAEIHRRHDSLKTGLGHAIGNPFDNVLLWSRTGVENIFVTWSAAGEPSVAQPYRDILDRTLIERPDLLILDTLADFYGGNEIVRAQVNHFVKAVLGRLIREAEHAGFKLTILLLAHPSTAGVASGTGLSGSTAWENAVRARLYLKRPDDGDSDERELVRSKANYAKAGDETKLRLLYRDGVFVPADVGTDETNSMLRRAKDQARILVQNAWMSRKPYTAVKGHARHIFGALKADLGRAGFDAAVAIQAIRELIEDTEISVSKGNKRRGYKLADEAD